MSCCPTPKHAAFETPGQIFLILKSCACQALQGCRCPPAPAQRPLTINQVMGLALRSQECINQGFMIQLVSAETPGPQCYLEAPIHSRRVIMTVQVPSRH